MKSVQFDDRRREVVVDGQPAVVTERVWQVLSLLVDKPGIVVTRDEIIDSVWDGNYLTGDKGLNQAIWTLRSILRDDKQAPDYIRTLPRKGYQWIAEVPDTQEDQTVLPAFRLRLAVAASLVVCASLFVGLPLLENSVGAKADDRIATKAWLVDRDIHVELASGCRGIVKNANYADISAPVLSADGRSLAVTVQEDQQCRMVTINVATGESRRFADCPLVQI